MENPIIKELSLEDQMIFGDLARQGGKASHGGRIEGFVVVRDAETGAVLFAKKNLVVRRGREMTLRKIFNLPGSIEGETESTLKEKHVFLFGIGSGGTPNSDPFNPIVPTPSDTDLSSPVAFRVTSDSVPMPTDSVLNYTDGRAGAGGTQSWFKKVFNNGQGELTINPATDEVFNRLELFISAADARDKFLNEIGLYFAKRNMASQDPNIRFTEYTMFSRFTFMTEPLPSATNKALKIDYYVYM